MSVTAAHLLRGWDRTEALRALPDVRAVPAGIRRPVPGGDGAVLDYRLPHTASHSQSHHQLRGLLLQHTQSLVPHWSVPGLARFLGIETRDTERPHPQYCVWYEQRRIKNVADGETRKEPRKEDKQSVCVLYKEPERK